MHTEIKQIIIASDHAAVELKEFVKTVLTEKGIQVEDVGPFSDQSVDYPAFGAKVAQAVSTGMYSYGILMCGTGQGMSMVANKYRHVRAALCNDLFSAIMSRRHNNSNILVMGGRIVGKGLATEIVNAWVHTPYEGGRHQTRIGQFDDLGACS